MQAAVTLGRQCRPAHLPVLISRILSNAGNGVQRLVEIANATAAPLRLYDPANLQSNWQLDGVFYLFPAGVELAAGGRAATSAEPAAVCLSGAAPSGVRVLGPLPLPLAAEEMDLALGQPTLWGSGMAVGTLDQVHYYNEAPWPYRTADAVLSRAALGGFGSEPANLRSLPGSSFAARRMGLLARRSIRSWLTDSCSFERAVNRDGILEIRWVAKPQAGAAAFRLLRSPLVSPESWTIVATQPVTAAQAGTAVLMQVIMPTPIRRSNMCIGCKQWRATMHERGGLHHAARRAAPGVCAVCRPMSRSAKNVRGWAAPGGGLVLLTALVLLWGLTRVAGPQPRRTPVLSPAARR